MSDFMTIRRALAMGPEVCRYHGDRFDFLGMERSEPRCESCREPWRIKQALAALGRIEARTRLGS